MVNAVHMISNKESVDYIALNLRSTPLKTASAWLLQNKILYILAKMPAPKLGGVVQIDEKYFRENQKGSHDLISFLDGTSPRKARRHNYRSECGIFGLEFVNVLCAVDNAGHHFAECVNYVHFQMYKTLFFAKCIFITMVQLMNLLKLSSKFLKREKEEDLKNHNKRSRYF